MSRLKIIRASAGSGKTFCLAQEYLRLLFEETGNFRHILAVTFTNKASEEMKSRIIRELYLLSANQPSKQLEGLMSLTNLNENLLRKRAGTILMRLLHQYSWFSVCTIDSFFQKIIRNFTRELGINAGYTIELDTDMVLTAVIRRLMDKAETDKPLFAWLVRFAESLIEQGESWNLQQGIHSLGRELFREKFRTFGPPDEKGVYDRVKLSEYQKELQNLVHAKAADYSRFGKSAMEVLSKHNLTVEDFSGKSRGPAGFLVKLSTGDFKTPSDGVEAAATSIEKWVTANAKNKTFLAAVVCEEFMPLLQQAIGYYHTHSKLYFTALVILKNLYTLGIITDLSQLTDEWCRDNDTFLLPEAPVFLNKLIDENDAPFIYEKAGNRYHHFMIDEFQDTSLLQWQNFRPLISNSMSQDFDNLVVGDVKQSIYRWRNSDWDILENQVIRDFTPDVVEEVTLTKNWRSLPNIINFNSTFFKNAAEVLENSLSSEPIIKKLYDKSEQQPGNESTSGGLVEISFLEMSEDSGFRETANTRLFRLLCDLQDQGFHLNDIAILTRTNGEARNIADFLMNDVQSQRTSGNRFDVISDEALLIGNSTIVTFLVSLLRQILHPADQTNQYLVFSLLNNYINGEKEAVSVLPDDFGHLAANAGSYSLSEIVERLIIIFDLEKHTGELAYLQAFRDVVLEFGHNYGGIPGKFDDYWKEKGRTKSIAAPASQDSIRIMTIHKAKGLEFRVVILPYCNWALNSFKDVILWCEPQTEPLNKVGDIPVSYSNALKDTYFADDFHQEYQRQLIDNLNLLYVAFTRAQVALYAFCSLSANEEIKDVSDLIYKVFGEKTIVIGELPVNMAPVTEPEGFRGTGKAFTLDAIAGRFRTAFQGSTMLDEDEGQVAQALTEGKFLHEIFNYIKYKEDIVPAVTRLLLQGKIQKKAFDNYVAFIRKALEHPQVSAWFSDDWTMFNESEIILPGGNFKRPDRVIFRENQTVIIEYKFGFKKSASYEKQLKEYMELMQNMGYTGVEGYLWYVRSGEVMKL